MSRQHTYTNNAVAEHALGNALPQIGDDVRNTLTVRRPLALILGGGYGRGEGGASEDGELANDLDFFVLAPDATAKEYFSAALTPVSKRWAKKLNIDVDFCPVEKSELLKNSDTLMVQELLLGHEVIFGLDNALDFVPRIELGEIAWREGARLLLNRGTGLLMARQRLSGPCTAKDKEFILRNLRKVALGCGDALLVADHDYRQKGVERYARIKAKHYLPDLSGAYSEALKYKYLPVPPSAVDLEDEAGRMMNLFLQTMRLFSEKISGRSSDDIFTAVQYLINTGDGRRHRLKNLILSLMYAGKLSPVPLTEHPRVKLLARLIELLYTPGKPDISDYLKLWYRFN